MEFIDQYLDGLCRTCLIEVEESSHGNNTSTQWQSILDRIEECDNLRIAELLSTAVPQIQIQPRDELPNQICHECLQQLLSAFRFQQMCIQSDEQMRELVSTNQTEVKISMMEAFKQHELEICDTDSKALETAHSSSTHQNLEHSSIQKPLHEIPQRMAEVDAVQSSSLENINKELESCNDEADRFNEFIKNEPVTDEVDIMQSTLTIECKEVEEMNVSKDEVIHTVAPQSSAANQLESIDQLPQYCNGSQSDLTEVIKNEPIADDEPNIEYSDGDIIHSTISVAKEEVLAIESEEQQVNMRLSLHKCNLCNKSFKQLGYLKRHLELHETKGDEFQNDVRSSRRCHKDKSSQSPSLYRITLGEDMPYECPYCPLRFNHINNLNRHKQIHEGVKREACDTCGKKIRKDNLNKHKLRAHSKEMPHKCDFCERRFIGIKELRIHTNKHTGEKTFKCRYCECAFYSLTGLNSHLRTHLGVNIYRCEFCPLAFPLASECRLHSATHKNEDPETRERNIKALEEDEAKLRLRISNEKTHQPSTEESDQQLKDSIRHGEERPYECPYCPLRFRTTTDVSQHKQTHEAAKEEACDICGKKIRKSYLNKHKLLSHSKEKLHKCDFCEKRFISNLRLRIHRLTHTGEKPLKCKYCERAFAAYTSLKTHLRTHLGDNVYRCELCPLAFPSASERRLHFATHKNEDPETRERNIKALQEDEAKLRLHISKTEESDQQLKDRIRLGEDRPYECPYCPLRFRTTSNMNQHKQFHDAVKGEACDICGKKMRKRYLNKHKLVAHSKERSHKCDFCERRFITGQELRFHTNKHTGEKPFKCKYCERAYFTPNSLNNHIRTHLGDNVYRCKFCPLAFRLASERLLHFATHKNEDPETRERNMKALREEEAKLSLRISRNETLQPSTEESDKPVKDRIQSTENKPYECPVCPLRFRSIFCVNKHKQVHEGIQREACDICGKTMREEVLNKHKLLVHSEEKPHKCNVCEKRFISISALRLHTHIYTGEKPFKCKYCVRAYSTPTALKGHLRVHLGVNIYRCEFCPLAFPSASKRRLHFATHKNEDAETRELNKKALEEVEAKLRLHIPKTEESKQQLKQRRVRTKNATSKTN